MEPSAIITLAGQFGPLGLLIAYLLWKDARDEEKSEKLDLAKSAERAKLEEKKIAFDRERLEADKSLAASLAALTAVIQGIKR